MGVNIFDDGTIIISSKTMMLLKAQAKGLFKPDNAKRDGNRWIVPVDEDIWSFIDNNIFDDETVDEFIHRMIETKTFGPH